MLKHMLTSNGNVGNRVSRPDSSTIMEPRIDPAHRYRSPNSNAVRLQPLAALNVSQLNGSTLNTSKHSLSANSMLTPGCKTLNGGLNVSRARNSNVVNSFTTRTKQIGIKEMLVSLGLLCLVSLLLALLSLIFLLKISPATVNDIRELLRTEQLTVITVEEYVVVYEVTLALCALTLSLNLCCLLVCAIQFLFAVKLIKSPHGGNDRTNKYLQNSSVSRICAVGGFFISIPVFLTGIILYTFIQLHSTPAIITSVFIGIGIIFCGCAMVHNVFIWQREKTNAIKELALHQHEQSTQYSFSSPVNQSHVSLNHTFSQLPVQANSPFIIRPSTTTPPTVEHLNLSKISHPREASGSISPGMPTTALDLSSVTTTNSPHELSTLV